MTDEKRDSITAWRLTMIKLAICADRQMKDAARDTTHRASRSDLILQDFLCFSIQLVGKPVDPSYFVFES